ncbi:hypothetical protein JX266_013358 [Neoarthrinium moseri]|nr:hypothetical protein JX266_013358 [Neoarthrinium moseri]
MLILTLTTVAACVGFYIICRSFGLPHDANETRLIPSSFPIVGHVIGMIRHGSGYYDIISKIYLVNTPSLIASVDCHSDTISFAPYVVQFAKRILEPSRHALDPLANDLLESNGPMELRRETLKVIHDTLAPGKHLRAMTQAMLAAVVSHTKFQDAIEGDTMQLFDWTRKIVIRASPDDIYGAEKNPYQDDLVYNGFWP